MQSFIVNIPDDKIVFFIELIEQLDFELLEIDEQQEDNAETIQSNIDNSEKGEKDSFLDWDAEFANAKKLKGNKK